MPHLRKEIRSALVAHLKNKTGAGLRVYDSRPLSLDPKKLPSISIFTPTEKSTLSQDGEHMERRLTIQIEAAICSGNLGDDMDAFAEQIEAAILLDRRLGVLLADDLLLTSTDMEMIDTDAGFGGLRMIIDTTYFTQYAAEPEDGLITQLPTEVITEPNQTPIMYEEITGRDLETGNALPEYASEATGSVLGVNPPPPVDPDAEPSLSPPQRPDYIQPGECGPEGCDLPAWGGDQ